MFTIRNPFYRSKDLVERNISIDEWISYFTYAGNQYPIMGNGPSYTNRKLEEIQATFPGYALQGLFGNVIVFACVLSRLQVFSQARFQFQELRDGRPGDLFGDPSLKLLEVPEPGKTTSDLLAHMEVDVSLAGNAFCVREGDTLKRLRPDWVSLALSGDVDDPDAEVVGYAYFPGGPNSGNDPIPYRREFVAHYAPIPDPLARYRGMSWLTPVIREVMADTGFREAKVDWLEHGGTHNFLFQIDPKSMTKDNFESFVRHYRLDNEGAGNAAKSIFLRAAVDATPLGTNWKDSDLKAIIGSGETRIAAAAGVPPIVAGFSEGLEAATYSNYAQARRRFVDGTVRHLWQNAAASLQVLVPPPQSAARLWYDDRDIPALQEDLKERAEVQQMQAQSSRQLIEAGFEPDSVIDAITAGDLKRLKGKHTGMLSVQLQEPGAPSANGDGEPKQIPQVTS